MFPRSSSSRRVRASSLSCERTPPAQAFRLEACLPSAVRGPVDRFHGRQLRINTACRARRSGVQPFAIGRLT